MITVDNLSLSIFAVIIGKPMTVSGPQWELFSAVDLKFSSRYSIETPEHLNIESVAVGTKSEPREKKSDRIVEISRFTDFHTCSPKNVRLI